MKLHNLYIHLQFDLPRRQRKSFEVITKTALSDKLNKEQAIEVFNKIKKEYDNSPNTFGSSSGKKESVMELLVIVGNQIAGEYKDCEVTIKQGVPEINKIKSQ